MKQIIIRMRDNYRAAVINKMEEKTVADICDFLEAKDYPFSTFQGKGVTIIVIYYPYKPITR